MGSGWLEAWHVQLVLLVSSLFSDAHELDPAPRHWQDHVSISYYSLSESVWNSIGMLGQNIRSVHIGCLRSLDLGSLTPDAEEASIRLTSPSCEEDRAAASDSEDDAGARSNHVSGQWWGGQTTQTSEAVAELSRAR